MGEFMVDMEVGDEEGKRYVPFTGVAGTKTTFTSLPASLLESLGVEPTNSGPFLYPDGRTLELPFGFTWLRYNGKKSIVPVVFVDDGHEVYIGETTLEYLALEADLVNERLTRLKLRM